MEPASPETTVTGLVGEDPGGSTPATDSLAAIKGPGLLTSSVNVQAVDGKVEVLDVESEVVGVKADARLGWLVLVDVSFGGVSLGG